MSIYMFVCLYIYSMLCVYISKYVSTLMFSTQKKGMQQYAQKICSLMLKIRH